MPYVGPYIRVRKGAYAFNNGNFNFNEIDLRFGRGQYNSKAISI
jgi:hypothetical protein